MLWYNSNMIQRPWNYDQIAKICPICNTTFKIPRSHENKRRCCSTKCAGEYKTQKYLNAIKNQTEKKCYRCKEILPLTEFTAHSQKPDGLFPYCKKCHLIKNREWNAKNKEYIKKRARDYMRKYRIGQNGKDIWNVKNKRDYPLNKRCELCMEEVRLVYHHWDNSNFSKGIWICIKCHIAVHWLDKYSHSLYFNLKFKVNALASS